MPLSVYLTWLGMLARKLLLPHQTLFSHALLPVFDPISTVLREEDDPPRNPTPEPAGTDASKTMTAPGGTLSSAALDKMVDPPRPKKKTKMSEADKSIMIPENPSGPPLDDVSSLLHPLFDESDALFFDLFSFFAFVSRSQ